MVAGAAVLCLFKQPEEIAPVGQTFLHRPHRMHSGWLAFCTGSTPILHDLEQAPQLTHLLSSTRYLNTEMGLNTE